MPGGICPRCLVEPSVSRNNAMCRACRREYGKSRRPRPKTLEERLWGNVVEEDWEREPGLGPCWVWTGYIGENGYGMIQAGRITEAGHRAPTQTHIVSCRLAGKPLPDGYEWDHLCRNRPCLRPDHLQAVPHRINVLRGFSIAANYAWRDHCIYDHDLTLSDAWYYRPDGKGRMCRLCYLERAHGRRGDRRSEIRAF